MCAGLRGSSPGLFVGRPSVMRSTSSPVGSLNPLCQSAVPGAWKVGPHRWRQGPRADARGPVRMPDRV